VIRFHFRFYGQRRVCPFDASKASAQSDSPKGNTKPGTKLLSTIAFFADETGVVPRFVVEPQSQVAYLKNDCSPPWRGDSMGATEIAGFNAEVQRNLGLDFVTHTRACLTALCPGASRH